MKPTSKPTGRTTAKAMTAKASTPARPPVPMLGTLHPDGRWVPPSAAVPGPGTLHPDGAWVPDATGGGRG